MSRSDDEEFELFRQEMTDVTPLAGEEVADIKQALNRRWRKRASPRC